MITDKKAWTIVRVSDTDRRSIVGDTAEMYDQEDNRAVYFQSGCPDIRSVFVVAAKYLKRK